MTTETFERQSDEVDIDSFVDAEEQFDVSGFARLKSCSVVDDVPSDIPSDYADEFGTLAYDRYIVFEGERVSEASGEVHVVLPAEDDYKEIEVAREWTDSKSISGLAGRVVPLRHINGNSYRVPRFDGTVSGRLSIDTVSSLIDLGIFEYSDGDWYFNFNNSVVQSSSTIASLFLAFVFFYAVSVGSSLFMFGAGFFLLLALTIAYSSTKKR
jgi:hypothetical protein